MEDDYFVYKCSFYVVTSRVYKLATMTQSYTNTIMLTGGGGGNLAGAGCIG